MRPARLSACLGYCELCIAERSIDKTSGQLSPASVINKRSKFRRRTRPRCLRRGTIDRIVSIAVTTNPTAQRIAGQVTDAFPWDEAPRHLVRDRDDAFGSAYNHRVVAISIRDHPVAPRSPYMAETVTSSA